MSKKVVIIGAGISGLVAGIYARLAGLEAEIYESHAIVGGNCTGWVRKGYHIDGCIQWLTGTKIGTGVNDIWQTCGALTKDSQIYYTDKLASTIYEGKTYHMYTDLDRMESEFLNISHRDKAAIKNLVRNIKQFQNLNAPIKKPFEQQNILQFLPLIWKLLVSGRPDKKSQSMTIAEYANEFKSPILRQLLSCIFPTVMPAYTLFYCLGIRTSGDGGWPMGGSMELVRRMQQRFEDLGGKINFNSAVDKVIINNGAATGIKLKNEGREVSSDYIISAVDADMLLKQLLDAKYADEYFDKRYADKENNLVLTGTYVSMGVAANLSEYPSNVYIRPKSPLRINNTVINDFNVKIFNFDPKFAQGNKTVMAVLLTEDEFDFWKAKKESSEQEYKAEKECIANWVMEGIASVFPELDGKFEMSDVATPLTFNRYCNSHRGAYMSFIPSGKVKKQIHKGVINGVKNLYIAGQYTFPAGGLPLAAIAGKFAVQRLLKAEKISV